MTSFIERFEAMLAAGTDTAALRFGLAQAYAKEGQHDEAILHLRAALEHDPEYSAAWKLLGRSYVQTQRNELAIATYERGLEVAERRGDKQAVREMQVFLKRLRANTPPES